MFTAQNLYATIVSNNVVGMAFSFQQKKDNITCCFFGEERLQKANFTKR
jgi:hypothetical protein